MDALFDLIYRQPQLLMVIGSACSEVTKTLAEIVPYWNLILVSFASTSPALSEREKYKTFFRLAPADSSQNGPRAMFIHEFGWDTVAALYEIEGDYSLAVDEMGNTFEQNNITIKISTSFRRYEDIATNLVAIKEHDVRIIIGGYSERAARTVLCQAYNLSMYGPRYVWIMIGDYVEKWWEVSNDTTCTKSQLREAAEGYFTIDSLNSLGDDDMSSVNISVRQFMEDYDGKEGPRPMSPYATSTYDTVWTIALTLQQVMEHAPASLFDDEHPVLEQFTYQSGQEVRKLFLDAMQGLDFLGISGPISFEGPDRKGVSVISQNQRGKMTRIALYEPDGAKLNFFCRTCQPIIWLGGRAPRDKIVLVSRKKTIHSVAFLCVSSASVCGLILASGFLAYNLYHRSLRYIKLSSPKLNNVAVIGCMLVYAGIIVLGCDDTMLDELYYPYLCTARAFLFAAGFSLSFGAMFTKTYRVHQIFTRANRGLIKSKLLRDKQLLFIVGALLVVDSVVLIIWGFVDPMYKQITNLTMEVAENDQDLLYISQLTKCHSHHIDQWTGTLYAYKGLLLVFGVYMAWETRHVKIPALNDSRYIGMNVYNVVIMSVLVVTISNILSHQPTLAYVMESSFMLLSTTMTLCLLFVPKIYAIMTYKGEPVIAASGITVEAKCRRFAVDERREHFYRAEVQNRVYKREIVELDEEIVRLERLMELPVQPYPKLTKQLLCLLPESRVDPSPAIKRRWVQERDMCCSISDAGDICMGLSEDKSDDGHEYAEECSRPAQKPIRRRANRLSIRVATNYAYTKLCKLRPRFSVGSVNYKHDYEDLKGSPTSPDGFLSPVLPIGRSRSSHPFMRQEAVEENRRVELTTDSKQDSEKSETRTFETHISEDVDSEIAQDYSSVTFHVPSAIRDHLKVSCHVDRTGCEDTKSSDNVHAPMRRRRKYGNTLEIPVQYDECKISEADTPATEHSAPRIRRARSILEHERRTRIKKLQSDLRRIQKELQDLDELEYEVSVV